MQNVAIVPVGTAGERRRGHYRRRRYARAPMQTGFGGLILFGTGVTFGILGASYLHRYISGLDPNPASNTKLPTGIVAASVPDVATYNDLADAGKPGMGSLLAQVALGVGGILGGVFFPWAPIKFLSYGIGFGAIGHAAVLGISGYVIEPMLGVGGGKLDPATNPRTLRMFAHEDKAIAALNPPAGSSGLTSGNIGAPAGVSRRGTPVAAAAPALPVAQVNGRVPPLATMGAAPASPLQIPPAAIAYATPPTGTPPSPGYGSKATWPGAGPPPPAPPAPPTPPPQTAPPGGGGLTPNGGLPPLTPPPPMQPPAQPPAQVQPPAPCPSCAPDCTCQTCMNGRRGAYGEPPPEEKVHPLWAMSLLQPRRKAA